MTGERYIVQRLAAEARALGPDQVAEPVVAKAKLCLTDFLSAAFEAADLPWSRQAAGIAHACEGGTTAIALGRTVAPGDAAFANAVAGHGLVREDMHTASIAHIGIVVWPALLAFAARSAAPVTGKALLAAAVVGYEAGARLGAALMTAELARLFRPTGLIGAFAAAMAVGRLADLTEDELAVALSLATNCAAGLNEWPSWGGSEMYFQAGFAARNGLAAVDLARAGAFASPSIVEGEAGLFAAFARCAPDGDIALKLDSDPAILSVFHKAVPACNFAQTPAQAALAAASKLDCDSTEVAAIEARITRAASLYPGCDATGPFANVLQAKMSVQYGVASAVRRGAIDADSYAALDDPETARLIAATTLVVDEELTAAFPGRQGASVTLRCANGTEVSAHLDDVEIASPEMIGQRFGVWAAKVLGASRASELGSFLDQLETIRDVAPLDRLLRRGTLSTNCSGKA